jgi:hypothetical protein
LGGKILALQLKKVGVDVRVHDELFDQKTRDEDWLTVVGANGWFVLTKDKRIRTRTLERHALVTANVGAFFLTSGKMSGERQAEVFLAQRKAMERIARTQPRPFLATVSQSGVRILE